MKSQLVVFHWKTTSWIPRSSCSTVPIRFLLGFPSPSYQTHPCRTNRAGKIINAASSSKPCVTTGGYLYNYVYIYILYYYIYIIYNIYIYMCVLYIYWYPPGFLRIFWGSLTAGSKYIISQAPSHCRSEWCHRWNLPAPPRCSPCWRRLRGSPRRNQWRCLWR